LIAPLRALDLASRHPIIATAEKITWGVKSMKSFIAACAVALILAVGSIYVLNAYQEPASVAYKSSAVRI
jgi:hypothetical protein